jgi:hypothetical protein
MTDSVPVYEFSGISEAFARHGMTDYRAGRTRSCCNVRCERVYFENQWRNKGSSIDRATRDRHKVKHEVEDA